MIVPTAMAMVSARLDDQRLPRDMGWQNQSMRSCWKIAHSKSLMVEARGVKRLGMQTELHTDQDLASTWSASRVVLVKDRAIPVQSLSGGGGFGRVS